ncbi:transcription elongation factor GreA [Spirochaeta lutea]|uniref:Transcription elongation factor GreA n=1 Tax=Spirochaeta lutea TaxID=1480694 RepID=A0A098R4L3_9SPIO|nr:transcription elongation factor GreA [Spirochaeta lutea]KGE73697.1 transcription elongation factor GreA [Spirochaeta lutea]
MSEKILEAINEQLNEEKWTRAALNNYTVNNLTELDDLLDQVFDAKIEDEVEKLCDEHLQHTKNSIVALYLSGVIHLSRQSIDDSNLLTLITIFTENHRWKIVEFLSERILDFGENKHALRHLSDCYEHTGDSQKQFEVWERLIRVDYDEADIARKLAVHAEEESRIEDAVDFYKKAIHRYINKKTFSQIMELWRKLVELVPEEVDFFYHAESKVSKLINQDRSVQLLEELYPYFKKHGKWDTAIELLKRILSYDSSNSWARKEIVECYQNKFEGHSQLEEYISLSNLNQSWRDVHEAIADFEKHISFDKGNFVFHRHWGVGRIKSIKDDEITVHFVKKRNHKMSLKMAVNSLTILGRDHIWVYRITKKKEVLNERFKKNPEWALKVLIKSFDNATDMKKIKAEVVPHILSQNEWSTWSTKARQILKTNETFGNLPDDPDTYVVRDQPISLVEKTFNRFKAEKDYWNRVKIIQEFLKYLESEDDSSSIETDMFREMFEYFVSYVRNITTVTEITIGSHLLIKKLIASFPFLNPGLSLNFRDLFNAVESWEHVFPNIDNPELRRDFLTQVRKQIKNWNEVYIMLIPHYLQKEPVNELVRGGYKDAVIESFMGIYQNYKDQREPFIWYVKNCAQDEWFQDLPVTREKILIAMIHLEDITAREIDNRKDVSVNRKLNRQVEAYLYRDGTIYDYIENGEEESISRIFSLIEDVKDLDPGVIRDVRFAILKKYPNFQFYGDQETPVASISRGTFYTLARSLEEKQKALQHLLEVEVPKNSKEIAAARDYGDLKENAEYKAAKERQDILNNTAARWKEELERAQVVRKGDISTDSIGFGTKVILENLKTGNLEQFTIMGPWESNPEKSILSHQSPFGMELLNKKAGQELRFVINEREYNYRIDSIELADVDSIQPNPSNV